jgi:hypothetical protein
MAMTTVSPSEGGGGGALEEAAVSTSCRAAVTSTSRVAMEACSSPRRRAMAPTRV